MTPATAAAGRADLADFAVVGGGPAGAVTALLLARAGASVVLFERSRYDTLRLGETLPPSVNPLLRDLGLWQRFSTVEAVPSHQTASVWGGAEPADRSFVFSPYGNGWHVDRASFDAMLADAAAEAGARVLRGTRVRAVTRVAGGVLVDAGVPVLAGTVVDATGRAARVAAALGARREQLDHLVCAARVFEAGPGGDTFIEAAAGGWWYASPLPGGRRLVACFTDARLAARARLATVEGWCAAVAGTSHVARLTGTIPAGAVSMGPASMCPSPMGPAPVGPVPVGAVHVVSCASHQLHPCAAPDWIAVGDAALAVDPLSSGGVAFALRSARAAADVLLGAPASDYPGFVAQAAREYRTLRTRIYAWERRFTGDDFWRARAG